MSGPLLFVMMSLRHFVLQVFKGSTLLSLRKKGPSDRASPARLGREIVGEIKRGQTRRRFAPCGLESTWLPSGAKQGSVTVKEDEGK